MARINIEDSLYRDPRWLDLVDKIGCRFKALGIIVWAWTVAQDHWLKNKCIPGKYWRKEFDILVDVELAEKLPVSPVKLPVSEDTVGDKLDVIYYLKGSKKAFAWLEQRSECGKLGGRPKGSNRIKQPTEKAPGLLRIPEESGPNPLTPTLTLTQKNNNTYMPIEHSDPVGGFDPKEVWNSNCGSLPKIEKLTPDRGKKVRDRLKSFPEPDNWIKAIQCLAGSDFANGGGKDGWRANFDFLVKSDQNFSKALEGNYVSTGSKKVRTLHL